MAPHAIALDPLIVTSRREVPLQYVGFYRRSRSGMGRFVTREDIERRRPIRTTDMLQMMPRVSLTNLNGGFAGTQVVTMRGTGGGLCIPNVYVDGMPHMSAEDINTLQPDDIDGIEVYTSPAMTPAEYQRNTSCGAILFWLRKDVEGRAFTWKRLLVGVGAFLGLVLLVGN
jgi:outer membrane cobalamin receptor